MSKKQKLIELAAQNQDDAEPGWFETAVEAEDFPNCWHIKPTHWMSLPGAPAALTTQGESHVD